MSRSVRRPGDRARLYDRLPLTTDVDWWQGLAASSGDERVLYLGCGTGRLAIAMARACRHLTGVDHDPAMLDRFRAHLAGAALEDGHVRLVEARVQDLSLDEQFGLVVAPTNLLNELVTPADQEAFLTTAARHCRADGRIVVQILNPYAMACGEGEIWGWIDGPHDAPAIQVTMSALEYEPWTQRYRARLVYRFADGDEVADEVDAALLFPGELAAVAAGAGLRVARAWGGTPGEGPPERDDGTWHVELVPGRPG